MTVVNIYLDYSANPLFFLFLKKFLGGNLLLRKVRLNSVTKFVFTSLQGTGLINNNVSIPTKLNVSMSKI